MICKVLIIGQAPPEKSYRLPFGGTRLYKWLNEIGIEERDVLDSFIFEALVSEFPGQSRSGHKLPNKEAIEKHITVLVDKMNTYKPMIIVPVGKMAIEYILGTPDLSLSEVIGRKFYSEPFGRTLSKYTIIPLPHPSGASPWVYDKKNAILLNNALKLIKDSI